TKEIVCGLIVQKGTEKEPQIHLAVVLKKLAVIGGKYRFSKVLRKLQIGLVVRCFYEFVLGVKIAQVKHAVILVLFGVVEHKIRRVAVNDYVARYKLLLFIQSEILVAKPE